MDNKLMLMVNFLGVDKLSGPLKNIFGGSKRAAAEMKDLRTEAKRLEKELAEVGKTMKSSTGNLTWLINKENQLEAALERTTAQLQKRQKAEARVANIRNRADAFAGKTGSMGMNASLFVTAPIVAGLVASVNASREANMAMAQTKASIASMGPVAQRTFPQLQAQAEALMKTSLFDDDEILRKVTANMLTFGKISGANFDRAQLAAVNLATKMDGDLQGATMMVGKALNDPVKGLAALGRAGIQFDAGQKAMIKTMVKTGNVAGAQAIMLGELDKQFAGSAAAARAADPVAAAAIDLGEFQQQIGDKLLPTVARLAGSLSKLLDSFNALSPGTQDLILKGALLAAAFGPVMTGISGTASVIGLLARPISWLLSALPMVASAIAFVGRALLLNPIGLAVTVIAGAAYLIYRNWGAVSGFFSSLWQRVKAIFASAPTALITAVMPMIGIPLMIYRNWGAISGFFGSVWSAITGRFNAGVASVKAVFGALPGWLKSVGKMMMDGLLLAINPFALGAKLIQMAKSGIAQFKSYLGIKSPSRVFMVMGGHITEGLAIGLDRGSGAPLRSIGRISRGVVGAAALGMASPSMAGTPAGGAPSGQARTGMAAGSVTYNVTIQLASSGNPAADAQAIKRELDHLLAIDARTGYQDV